MKRKRPMAKGVQKPSKRKAKENGTTKSTSTKTKTKPTVAKKTENKASSKPSKPSGTRTGPRLTRAVEGDGWQKVPEEWLQEPPASSSPQTQTTDVEALFDDDLTDLSEEDNDDDGKREESSDSDLTDLEEESDEEDNTQDTDVKMEVDPQDDGEFVEFETVGGCPLSLSCAVSHLLFDRYALLFLSGRIWLSGSGTFEVITSGGCIATSLRSLFQRWSSGKRYAICYVNCSTAHVFIIGS
jgi:hypothetical protein